MAVMHPADLENYECTTTEREMYEAFRDQLPEKYQVLQLYVRLFQLRSAQET